MQRNKEKFYKRKQHNTILFENYIEAEYRAGSSDGRVQMKDCVPTCRAKHYPQVITAALWGRSSMTAEGVCPFPLPPTQYYKLYTDENVEDKAAPDPPPTLEGAYSMFGASFEVT